jgi:MoaA/NifB/PqqE/SkfB family radical SAM enzyme
MNYLHSPSEFANSLASIGVVPRDFVFYLTSVCNLRCKHCYVGDALLDAAESWRDDNACALLHELELDRLTLIGGEPLLYYGINAVLESVCTARIREKRMTTNLTTLSDENIAMLKSAAFRVSVSIDGPTAELHDAIRGSGAFERTIRNLRRLVGAGVDVEVTHTVTPQIASAFNNLVSLLRSLKVQRLNLHKVSAQGNATENRSLVMSASQWRSFIETVQKISAGQDGYELPIIVRYPLLFVNALEYEQLKRDGYHHHVSGSYYSARGHRVVLYCSGEVFISSEAFGTDASIGRVVAGHFEANSTARNEIKLTQKAGFQISDINPEIQGDTVFPIPLSFSYRRTITI